MYSAACCDSFLVDLYVVCIMRNREVIRLLIKRCLAVYTESRSGPHWRKARKTALMRDRYTCVSCGSKRRLEVHHGNGWKWFRRDRFSIWNLFTLCKPCHAAFHKWNGGYRKKCTIQKYREWTGIAEKRRVRK